MAEQKFKPVGYLPVGWAFRKIFVDDDGNVFRKGKHCPDEKGSMQFTSRKLDDEKEALDKENQEKTEQEALGSKISMTVPEGTLPQELIDKLIATFTDKLREEKEKMIEEFQKSLQTTNVSGSANEGIRVEEMARAIARSEQYKKGGVYYRDLKDVDPKDFNKDGATFTCYGTGYLIIDDVRQGHSVTTPYGRIFKFRFQSSRIVKIGKVESYSSFCSFFTNSIKEIEWLRNHTLYNIEFYEDTKLALEADAQLIPIAAKIFRQISALDQPQVLARAEQYKIKLGGDLRDVIQQLAVRMAKEEMVKLAGDIQIRNKEALEAKIFD